MSSRLRQLRTLALYFLIPALGAATPLVVFPALTSAYGSEGLAAVGIAQSLGTAGLVIAELGWAVLGPQRVSRQTPGGRGQTYRIALFSKLISLPIVGGVAVLAAVLLAQQFTFAAAIICLGFVSQALSPSWFLIGLDRPLLILFYESLPRLILSLAAALMMLAGAGLWAYGAALLVATLVTQASVPLVLRINLRISRAERRLARRSLVRQMALTGGRAVSVVYTSLPIALVSIVAPSAVPVFTALERLTRMALSLLNGFPSRLQSWVGAGRDRERVRRSRRSLRWNILLGLVSGVGYALLAPTVARFVFSDVVSLSYGLSCLGGIMIAVVCASRGAGLSLVAEGRANAIALANIAAAGVGVLGILIAASFFGACGGVTAEILSELIGLTVQLAALAGLGVRRKHDRHRSKGRR